LGEILDIIEEVVATIQASGRKPRLIVLHPLAFIKLVKEFDEKYRPKGFVQNSLVYFEKMKLFGIEIVVSSHVTDCFIIDDRTWAELVDLYEKEVPKIG